MLARRCEVGVGPTGVLVFGSESEGLSKLVAAMCGGTLLTMERLAEGGPTNPWRTQCAASAVVRRPPFIPKEKYGKLKLIKLYLWLAELRKNQTRSKILKKDCSQKILDRYQEIL